MRLLAEDRPVVAVFWHAEAILCARELLLATPIAARARWTFLISPSVDGDAVTRLVERYGGRVVRGSATRTGRTALLRLTRELEAGSSVVVVPDGPSGPARVAKPGAAALAARAGSPLLPLAARASSRASLEDRTSPKLCPQDAHERRRGGRQACCLNCKCTHMILELAFSRLGCNFALAGNL